MNSTSALIDIGGSSVKVTILDGKSSQIYSEESPLSPKINGRNIFWNQTNCLKLFLRL
jgi:predicted NBD/HSP70 family sugar kinase